MPTCYEIDSSRASLKEYSWGSKNPIVLLISIVIKLLRIRIPGSSDDPNIDSTLGCVVESLPTDVSERFAPIVSELSSLGFYDPTFHFMEDLGTQTRLYWATLRHTSGQHIARVHYRYWGKAQNHDRGTFPLFITAFVDGTFLVSSSGKPDVAAPKTVQMNRMPRAPLAKLLAEHTRLANAALLSKSVRPINNRNEIIAATESLHLLQRDFHLARGFFRERSVKEQAQTAQFSASVEEARASGIEYPEVMAELTRLQEQKPKWISGLWMLVLSAIAFMAAGSAQWNWKTTLWLIPILLFHEFGHWIAMRICGYRNLRMFFIPFFGAAVTGKSWNVPGWKKALVSLAGPLPGIFLGVFLGVAGMIWNIPMLQQAALMLILLNAFNLLPVLPLDGGHFLHSILFCRNRWLDITFRTVAVIALLSLSAFGMGKAMMYIGIVLAIALPVAFKMGKITDQLRREPLPVPTPGEDRIPAETAKAIITSVKTALPKNASNKVLAQHSLNIFETLNAHPPNAWASFGLLALYGSGFIASILFGVLLVISKEGRIGDFMRSAANQPRHTLACNSTRSWQGSSVDSSQSQNFIVTTFKKPALAQTAFSEVTPQLPATSGATLFGDSLIISLPTSDNRAREEWFEKLQARSTNLFVAVSNSSLSISLTFVAQSAVVAKEINEDLEQYFGAQSMGQILPPWDPAYAQPAFAHHRESRRVWSEIQKTITDHWKDTNFISYTAKIAAAQRKGSADEANRLAQEQQERGKLVLENSRKAIHDKYATTAFASMVDLEAELAKIHYTNRQERAALTSKLALELGGTSDPHHASYSFGNVSRNGLLLEVSYLSLQHPDKSLPQLLDWLCQKYSTQIRYNFQNFGGGSGYDDDEL